MLNNDKIFNDSKKIGKMTKISLSLLQKNDHQNKDSAKSPEFMEFIYGIGPGGITEFEHALTDKQIGDEIIIFINKDNIHKIFGHLTNKISIIDEKGSFNLNVKVLDIKKAEKIDILKTLLKTCPQGCGCGNY